MNTINSVSQKLCTKWEVVFETFVAEYLFLMEGGGYKQVVVRHVETSNVYPGEPSHGFV